jgi:hypothetical protein
LVVGVGGWWMVDGWVQVAFFDDLSSRSLMWLVQILVIRASLTFCRQAFVPSDDALGIWGVTGDVWWRVLRTNERTNTFWRLVPSAKSKFCGRTKLRRNWYDVLVVRKPVTCLNPINWMINTPDDCDIFLFKGRRIQGRKSVIKSHLYWSAPLVLSRWCPWLVELRTAPDSHLNPWLFHKSQQRHRTERSQRADKRLRTLYWENWWCSRSLDWATIGRDCF